MPGFLDDYEPVEDRLAKFWEDYPDGRIITELLPAPEGQYIVKASVFRAMVVPEHLPPKPFTWGEAPDATGHAQEHVTAKGVNSTSALENCETSAIGRALANLGYAAKGKRASREEMEKANRSEIPEEETEAIAAWRWLWEQAKIYKAWADDERMEAIKAAMKYLAIEEVNDRELADRIFTHLKGVYESRPMQEQGELPVT